MPIALVTGGAIRVGRAISMALAEAGYDILIHVRRSRAQGEELAAELVGAGRRAAVLQADLAMPEGPLELARAVTAQCEAWQGAAPTQRDVQLDVRLDVLVNSAADYAHVDFADVTPAQFDAMFATNVRAPFFLVQALLPLLRRSANACIVNITDMAVSHAYSSTHFFSHYVASKGALEQLTRSWAQELGPTLRVNAVAPGPVAMAAETNSAQRDEILRRTPMAREGSPEDIGQAVVYFTQARYVTGQVLRIDGGLSVG